MSTTTQPVATRKQAGMAVLFLVGAAMALSIRLYARLHTPSGRPVSTLGFSGILQMKAWLTTAATSLLIVQLLTALWMWGHVPGPVRRHHGPRSCTGGAARSPSSSPCRWPSAVPGRSGSRPTACGSSCMACAAASFVAPMFYGAYAAKMLGLRLKGLPRWALPVLGGSVLTLLIALWMTAALWFFTRQGIPLT